MGEAAVLAEGLVKTYQGQNALDGFDLEVAEGSVCGLLGPNGAGKTTAVRILATLLRPDGGRARVAGFDPVSDASQVRRRIGLLGQEPTVDEVLTGRENLVMWARLHHFSRAGTRARVAELLDRFRLGDAADKQVKHYSGGMRRRLDLAASFVLAPRVLFLDEPTTGLDPRNRNDVWSALRGLVAEGTTVLLTTQYLDEADQLADHIVVMNEGRAIADGTPGELKARLGGDRLDVVLGTDAELPVTAAILERACGAPAEIDAAVRRVSAPVRHRVAALAEAARALEEAGIEPVDVALRKPTLDEVFLSLTEVAA